MTISLNPFWFPILCRGGPRTRRVGRRFAACLAQSALESLEDRTLLTVNLRGVSFNSAEPLNAGQDFRVDFAVTNSGNTAAPSAMDIAFYLSTNAIFTTGDYLLGTSIYSPLGAGGSINDYTNLYLPVAGDAFYANAGGDGTYYIGMIIDPQNLIAETNENDNDSQGSGIDYDAVRINGTTGINLLGEIFDVTPEPLNAGSTFNIDFQVRNAGTVATSGVKVDFYISPNSSLFQFLSNDRKIGSYTFSDSFGPGTGVRPAITLTLPPQEDAFYTLGDGTYTIGMYVDPDGGTIAETNENDNYNRGSGLDLDAVRINNTVGSNLRGSNFNVIPATANAGGTVAVDLAVENTGSIAASNVKVNVYLSKDSIIATDDRLLGTYTFGSIAAFASATATQNFALPIRGDAYYSGVNILGYLGMIVDPDNAIFEGNETDNSNRGPLLDLDNLTVNNSRDDSYEPNDTLATAIDISDKEQTLLSNIAGAGVAANDDWYKVEVTPGFRRLVADVTFPVAEGDLDLHVVRPNGTVIYFAEGGANNERADVIVPTAGIYYLRVFSFGAPRGNLYDLVWDDLPTPTVSVAVAPAVVNEDGAANLIYTFTRTGTDLPRPFSANFTIGGTATYGTDYTLSGASYIDLVGTVNFAPGSSTATVIVDPTADATIEPNETVILTLTSTPTGRYELGTPGSATGTIRNDDPAAVSVEVNRPTVLEDGSDNLVYTFTRGGSLASALTVNFRASGTATAGNDYFTRGATSFNGTVGTITFAAGARTAQFVVDPFPDTAVEPHENVRVDITAGNGYSIGTPSGVGAQILNDDPPAVVTVAVNPSTVNEDGLALLTYSFTRSGGLISYPLSVTFRASGSAIAGNDYYTSGATSFNGTVGTITFAAGATTKTFLVNPADDAIVEPNETLRIEISAGGGYTPGTQSGATGTIRNDDPAAVSVEVNRPTVLEDGSDNLVYTFTRGGSLASALTVNFRASGTATAGNDYFTRGATSFNGTVGTITFAAGARTVAFTVDPFPDSATEPHENVRVDITAGNGYSIGTPSGVGAQILNDDSGTTATVTVAVNRPTVLEDGPEVLIYTFTRSGSTASPLIVNFRASGSATAGNDYYTSGATSFNGTVGTITFAAGATTRTFLVSPADDAVGEPHENVRIDISTGDGYTTGAQPGVGAQILNDDPAPAPLPVAASVKGGEAKSVAGPRFAPAKTSATVLPANRIATSSDSDEELLIATAPAIRKFFAGRGLDDLLLVDAFA